MESLKIKFFNPRKIFFTTKPIRGYVEAKLTKPLTNVVVEMEFTGFYYLRDGSGGYEKLKFAGYVQKLYIDVSGMDRGTSESPFRVYLEPNFPSSMVCAAGSVQYKLVARCKYNLSSDVGTQLTIEEIKYLTVLQLIDTEQLVVARLGTIAQQYVGSYVLKCCYRRVCHMYMSTKRRAYVSGEEIEVTAMILNQGSRLICDVEIRLVQVVESEIKRRYATTISSIEKGEIPTNNQRQWYDEKLPIPPLPPSTDDPHISISYSIELALRRSNNKSYVVSIPIIIGTKPLETIAIASVKLKPSFLVPGSVDLREEACAYIPTYPVYTPAVLPEPEEMLAETGF